MPVLSKPKVNSKLLLIHWSTGMSLASFESLSFFPVAVFLIPFSFFPKCFQCKIKHAGDL